MWVQILASRFVTNRKGSIATMAALSMPLLLGAAALGTEAGYWLTQKSKLRGLTDGAAITAANLYQRRADQATIEASVKEALAKSGINTSTLFLDIDLPAAAGDPLKVVTRIPGERYFSTALWNGTIAIDARTDIEFSAGNVCVLAASPTADGALNMGGSSLANFSGCLAASNSTSSSSIAFSGSSQLTAGCLYSAGYVLDAAGHTTLECSNLMTGRREVALPLANMTQPLTPARCNNAPNFNPNSTVTVSPGCYSSNFNMKGIVHFQPGVYILNSANFTANAQAIITGTDVTFILKGDSTVDFNGGANIQLKAPEEGSGAAYEGILFWGSTAAGTRIHKINGSAGSIFQGLMSFANDDVQFNGNSGVTSSCLRLVGKTVALRGNTDFNSECDAALGGLAMTAGNQMRIIR